MTTQTVANTDRELQRQVLRELEWEPRVDATRIAVAVLNGVVTLSGRAPNYLQRLAAEKAAKRVYGVRAVVNEIEVDRGDEDRRSDEDIARDAVHALKWNIFVPAKDIKVAVEHGRVTLTGEVRWNFQREAAEDAVAAIDGVEGVTNRIVVKPKVSARELRARIEEAVGRSAGLAARRINVHVQRSKVILTGRVSSWAERDLAERTAWAAPGVEAVDNQLEVGP
ncbi:MAG TPA: BON domain-containing protein [Tepidisphaeraceae bacterium]